MLPLFKYVAKVRIFPFPPNFCDESSGNLCSVCLQNTIGHNMSNKYYNCFRKKRNKIFWVRIYLWTIPLWVLSVQKKCLLLYRQSAEPFGITYCESVFRKSLHENVEVFRAKGRTEQHSLSFRYLWTGTFCVPRYPISIRVWGIVSFVSNRVLPQPSVR